MCCGDGEDLLVLVGKWADPDGTAMPGQPVTGPDQAPEPHPVQFNQFDIEGGTCPPYQILT